MVSSTAQSVTQYLKSLPADRRKDLEKVRAVILKNLPKGYEEGMSFGMIGYYVPLSRYPITYNKQPLCYAALAAQKNANSLYLMGVYGDPALKKSFEDGFRKAGKKLDMGKSCVRFQSAEELPLELVGKTIAQVGVDAFIEKYEAARASTKSRSSTTTKSVKAAAARKTSSVKKASAKKKPRRARA